MAITEAQRAELIRRGNQLFNEGKYFDAGRVYSTVGYKAGLIRLGDLFYFDKQMPLVAYGFYRKAAHKPMLEKIGDSFVFALKCLLADDRSNTSEKTKIGKSEDTQEELKVRQANSPEELSNTAKKETIERKIERALGLLRQKT